MLVARRVQRQSRKEKSYENGPVHVDYCEFCDISLRHAQASQYFWRHKIFISNSIQLNNWRWDNKPIIPKKTQQTDLIFRHNQIFALFSSVAVQREQRKNQKQGNIYKDLSVRSCAESVCAQCACVKCSCDF